MEYYSNITFWLIFETEIDNEKIYAPIIKAPVTKVQHFNDSLLRKLYVK